MRPGIWTDAFQEFEPDEALERLARIGWKNVELAEKHVHDIDKRPRPEKHILRLKKFCDQLGISIMSVHAPIFNLCDQDLPRTLEEMPLMAPTIRWAGMLGARWVVIHPGTLPMLGLEEVMDEVRQKNLCTFREFATEAHRAGVGIAVENLPDRQGQSGERRFGATPQELLWLVAALERENVGICWDTGHARLQGLDQYRAIKALGKHLVTTHIHDNDGLRDQHLLPFAGSINWQELICALREIDYRGYFVLEIGGAVHGYPIPVREAKLAYALELTKVLVTGQL